MLGAGAGHYQQFKSTEIDYGLEPIGLAEIDEMSEVDDVDIQPR